MTEKILLGYEIGSGREIYLPLHHLIVTGLTQLSGKTTTLEALLSRGNLTALTFRTKRGELGFESANKIPLYFSEQGLVQWRALEGLLSAVLAEKVGREPGVRSAIIRLCSGARSLDSIYQAVVRRLRNGEHGRRLRGFERDVYEKIRAYLDLILPQLQRYQFAQQLSLKDGLNMMDLEGMTDEMQALVIFASIEWIHRNTKDTILVLPEAWNFLPQDRGSPVKVAAERYMREGGAIKNFLWIDSQDLRGVDKKYLRQIDNWILGRQRDSREIKATLDAIPLAKNKKPPAEEIQRLGIGHFFACLHDEVVKVYVQPAWLTAETAKRIAKGELDINVSAKPLPHMEIKPDVLTLPRGLDPGEASENRYYGGEARVDISTSPDGEPILLRMARENAEGKLSGTDPMTRMANLMADQQKRIDNLETEIKNLSRPSPLTYQTIPSDSTGGPARIEVTDPSQIIEVSDNLESLRVDTNGLRGQIAKTILEGNIPSQLFNATRLRTILISMFGNKAEQWDVDSILNELKSLSAPPYRLFTFDSKHRLFRLRSQAKDRVKE